MVLMVMWLLVETDGIDGDMWLLVETDGIGGDGVVGLN